MQESIKTKKTTVKEWAKNNLVGNRYSSAIGMVSVTLAGIKETINQPHRCQIEKLEAIYTIEKLLAEAEFVIAAPDNRGRALIWHYLKITIAENNSYIVIREDIKLEIKLLYSIVDSIK